MVTHLSDQVGMSHSAQWTWGPSGLLHHHPTSKPEAHLAEVVKVVFVPDPAVTGFRAVRLVGDISRVLTLTHKELPFEELEVHVCRGQREVSCKPGNQDSPILKPTRSEHTLGGGTQAWGQSTVLQRFPGGG